MSAFAPDAGPEEARRNKAVMAADHIAAVAKKQDKASYAALFRHFAPRIKAYLQLTGLPAEAAEELAQETMFRVWRNAHRFDVNRGAAASWVYQIARNLRRDGIRHEKISRAARGIVLEADICPADPESIFLTRLEEIGIEEAVRALEPKLYEPIRLAFFEDLSHSQVAKRLGVPLGTVKSRVRVAVETLRRGLSRPTEPLCAFDAKSPERRRWSE